MEIAQEIEASIDFLATSMRDIPERQRSLSATFDHSWRLLSDAEQDPLSRMSVFHGEFDRIESAMRDITLEFDNIRTTWNRGIRREKF